MLQLENLHQPRSLSEAYQLLTSTPDCVVLGGCGYLRLGSRRIVNGIDLSLLGLDQISETDDGIEIGAMTSLRTIETSEITSTRWSGLLAEAVANIVGVQLRNSVTIGGSVAGRYPFSDPITALMAVGCQVILHNHGAVDLADYLANKPLRDIVVKLLLPRVDFPAAYASARRASGDYPVLNVAVSQQAGKHKVVVGSRPGRAMFATDAEQLLDSEGLSQESISKAARIAADTLQFGDNPRGSARYRQAICPVLLERALTEVMHAA